MHACMHAYCYRQTGRQAGRQTDIALHCSTLHYVALPNVTLRYIPLHSITFHCIPLHSITFHYIRLHSITLHSITHIQIICTHMHTYARICIHVPQTCMYILHCFKLDPPLPFRLCFSAKTGKSTFTFAQTGLCKTLPVLRPLRFGCRCWPFFSLCFLESP